MKGKLCFVAAALVACILTAPFAAPRAAAENSVLPDFSDNFDSYEADGKFIEENEEFAKNWTNNVLAGGEEQGIDAHLKGIGKIEYENGESGNKVLHLDNASVGMDSYFHIGPAGDYRTKNFTAGFRLKFMTKNAGERGWAGISFRKKATAHYVGTNNLLFTVQRYTKNTEITPHTYAVFNGGATNDFGDASMQSMFGDALRFEDASYKVPSSASGEDMPWVDYKLEVNGNTYKMYLDDFLVADCTFDVKTFDYFGFLSLNCCTADILVDDFYVNIADTELPPVIEKLPSPVVALGEDGNVDKVGQNSGQLTSILCISTEKWSRLQIRRNTSLRIRFPQASTKCRLRLYQRIPLKHWTATFPPKSSIRLPPPRPKVRITAKKVAAVRRLSVPLRWRG